MAAGALWNSGLFAWTAERLLAEVARHTPEVARRPAPARRRATSPGFFRGGHADLDRRRPARAERRRGGGERGVRLGRRRHLAGAGARAPEGPERQRARGPGVAAGVARLHRLVGPRSDRALRGAGPRRRAGQRPDPGHADRARRRDEAAARRPAARDPRHRPRHDRASTCSSRSRAGRRVGAVRRRAADRGAPRRRVAHPRALGGGLRRRGHARSWARTSTDSIEARRAAGPAAPAPIDGPRDRGRLDVRARRRSPRRLDRRRGRRLQHRGVTVGWIVAAGRAVERPARAGRRGRDRRAAAPRRVRPASRRSSGSWPRTAPTCGRRRRPACPRAASSSATRQTSSSRRGGRAGRGVRRAPGRGRARARRRGAARHPARGPAATSARTRKLLGGFIRALGVRPGVPGARRDLGQRLSRLRQQEPRRVRRAQRRRALGQPRRAHHHVQPQEHLRAGAPRRRRPVGSRPAGRISAPCSATTPRRRSAPCSPPAPWCRAGANVFGPPTPPKYVPPFAWGGASGEASHGRRLPPRRRAGDAAPRASS